MERGEERKRENQEKEENEFHNRKFRLNRKGKVSGNLVLSVDANE